MSHYSEIGVLHKRKSVRVTFHRQERKKEQAKRRESFMNKIPGMKNKTKASDPHDCRAYV